MVSNSIDLLARSAIDVFRRNPQQKKARTEDFWALQDVCFDIEQGEKVGIIGRNGAGKSTLLKIISQITEPTGGEMRISGRVTSLLEVGTGFHPELSGRENIFLNGTILGMTRREIQSKFDEIVAFSEIEKFIDTPVKRYSSGMYVRLAFAVAAHLDTEILIIDEILAVGDLAFQNKCFGKMEEVGKAGRTVVIVSHNMSAIKRLTNSAILIDQGKIIQNGETEACINKYLEISRIKDDQIKLSFSDQTFEMSCMDDNGKITNNFPPGSDIKFMLNFDCDNTLSNIDFHIAIYTSENHRLTTLSSRVQSPAPFDLKQTTITADWKQCPLAPGRYHVALGIYQNGYYQTSWERIMEINIDESDYYNTGKMPEPWMGPLLTHCNWKKHQPSSPN